MGRNLEPKILCVSNTNDIKIPSACECAWVCFVSINWFFDALIEKWIRWIVPNSFPINWLNCNQNLRIRSEPVNYRQGACLCVRTHVCVCIINFNDKFDRLSNASNWVRMKYTFAPNEQSERMRKKERDGESGSEIRRWFRNAFHKMFYCFASNMNEFDSMCIRICITGTIIADCGGHKPFRISHATFCYLYANNCAVRSAFTQLNSWKIDWCWMPMDLSFCECACAMRVCALH